MVYKVIQQTCDTKLHSLNSNGKDNFILIIHYTSIQELNLLKKTDRNHRITIYIYIYFFSITILLIYTRCLRGVRACVCLAEQKQALNPRLHQGRIEVSFVPQFQSFSVPGVVLLKALKTGNKSKRSLKVLSLCKSCLLSTSHD